jgi:AbrB family looped-hinge helix DNA binding protein
VTSSVSTKGQIVIPQEIRERKQIRAGDDLEFIDDPDDEQIIILRKIQRRPNRGLVQCLKNLKGMVLPSRSGRPARRIKL